MYNTCCIQHILHTTYLQNMSNAAMQRITCERLLPKAILSNHEGGLVQLASGVLLAIAALQIQQVPMLQYLSCVSKLLQLLLHCMHCHLKLVGTTKLPTGLRGKF